MCFNMLFQCEKTIIQNLNILKDEVAWGTVSFIKPIGQA